MNDIDTKQVALRCVAGEPHEIHSWEDVRISWLDLNNTNVGITITNKISQTHFIPTKATKVGTISSSIMVEQVIR